MATTKTKSEGTKAKKAAKKPVKKTSTKKGKTAAKAELQPNHGLTTALRRARCAMELEASGVV